MMQNTFSDDAPKSNPWQEDKLGYAPFARRLSETILALDAPNGYVIGLHGAWGSGKSTVLRFVQAFIKKHQDENELDHALAVVDFRPWMVSGHTDLVGSFFKVLSETLKPAQTSRWNRVKRVLRWAKSASDSVVDAAAKVAVVAHPLSAPAVGAGSGVFKASFGAAVDRWLEEPSLQSAYDDLTKTLKADARKILVIVDDIDRLNADEIRSIMQMVKTVGSLPNVIYLLAYDRTIVGEALDNPAASGVRPGFSEKIVQHEVELPVPARDALLRLLDSELAFLAIPEEPGSMRHFELVSAGIRRWMASPRDVGRLSNALKFAWPAVQGEVDPFDFLCIESIRLFEPILFYWIRDNREFLMGDSFRYSEKDERDALIASLKVKLPPESLADNIKVLCALFPQRAEAFQGRDSFGSEPWSAIQLRRGIAFGPSYDAYFRLSPQPNAISKSLVDRALASLDDYATQAAIFRQLVDNHDHGASLVKQYLEELRLRLQNSASPVIPTQALLEAIFTVGDQILELRKVPEGFLEFPPVAYMANLLKAMFEAWGKEATARSLLAAFQAQHGGIASRAMVFVDLGRELGVLPSDHVKPAERITPVAFEQIGALMLGLIEAANLERQLDEAPFYFDIARAWAYLADEVKPRKWLTDGAMSNSAFLSKLAYGLLSHSTSGSGSFWQLRDRDLEPWYDRDSLMEACKKHKDATDLSKDERARIQALLAGLSLGPTGIETEATLGG